MVDGSRVVDPVAEFDKYWWAVKVAPVLHLLLLGFSLIGVATNIIRFVGELLRSHGHTVSHVTCHKILRKQPVHDDRHNGRSFFRPCSSYICSWQPLRKNTVIFLPPALILGPC
jgi:hypothetical protein